LSESEDIATMGQRKITDMFSSPPKGPSGHRSTTRNPQQATPSRIGANVSQPNPSGKCPSQPRLHE
jgi:hypothetical protein